MGVIQVVVFSILQLGIFPMALITLYHFPYSPFNEKARWALDFKGLEVELEPLMPGPHMPVIKKLTGQTSTPVVSFGDRHIAGSGPILDHLEVIAPEPDWQVEEAYRVEAKAWEKWLDQDVIPVIRRAILQAMLTDFKYFTDVFGEGQPARTKWIYRWILPFAQGLIRRGNGITEDRDVYGDARSAATHVLEQVAKRIQQQPYLFGHKFSRADLVTAAHLAMFIRVDHRDMARPEPSPQALSDFIDPFQNHPAAQWVRDMYRQHRLA